VDAPSTPSTLLRALRKYVAARNAALLEARRVLKIGELDARALLFVAEHPGTRPTQLREHLGITSAGVTTLVDRLVDRGAVRRDVDDADRRVNRITLTIDLAVLPWSALTQFDTDYDDAITAGDLEQSELFATALDGFTDSVVALARVS
jgi:hypothetical protein